MTHSPLRRASQILFATLALAFAGCAADPADASSDEIRRRGGRGGEPCGAVICEAGTVCCNASCGICTRPGGACTQQYCEPDGGDPSRPAPDEPDGGGTEPDPGPGEPCGAVICEAGTVCCNASCGICTPPDGACTQQICEPDGGVPSEPTPDGGATEPNPGGCVRTGCSGQICSDHDVASTCEWREEYACYGSARCERQADGSCGWTDTPELRACLAGTR